MKIIGLIPARMNAFRFPGKPLAEINGKAMLHHVYDRVRSWPQWDYLGVCTPDNDIYDACRDWDVECVMTKPEHPRATDRVAEAANILKADADDIIVCVQGDEPMVTPHMIEAIVTPLLNQSSLNATVLTVPIVKEKEWRNEDIVKVVTDIHGFVRYTSRAPIPHSNYYTAKHVEFYGARPHRIGGMFAYRKGFLDWFTVTPEHPLEIAESCDLNRINGNGRDILACPIVWQPYYSVDRPEDIDKVEAAFHA